MVNLSHDQGSLKQSHVTHCGRDKVSALGCSAFVMYCGAGSWCAALGWQCDVFCLARYFPPQVCLACPLSTFRFNTSQSLASIYSGVLGEDMEEGYFWMCPHLQ